MAKKNNNHVQPAPPITENRVFWGLLVDGQRVPDVLHADRKAMVRTRDMIPEPLRSKAQLVRAYVTVTRYAQEQRQAKRAPATRRISKEL